MLEPVEDNENEFAIPYIYNCVSYDSLEELCNLSFTISAETFGSDSVEETIDLNQYITFDDSFLNVAENIQTESENISLKAEQLIVTQNLDVTSDIFSAFFKENISFLLTPVQEIENLEQDYPDDIRESEVESRIIEENRRRGIPTFYIPSDKYSKSNRQRGIGNRGSSILLLDNCLNSPIYIYEFISKLSKTEIKYETVKNIKEFMLLCENDRKEEACKRLKLIGKLIESGGYELFKEDPLRPAIEAILKETMDMYKNNEGNEEELKDFLLLLSNYGIPAEMYLKDDSLFQTIVNRSPEDIMLQEMMINILNSANDQTGLKKLLFLQQAPQLSEPLFKKINETIKKLSNSEDGSMMSKPISYAGVINKKPTDEVLLKNNDKYLYVYIEPKVKEMDDENDLDPNKIILVPLHIRQQMYLPTEDGYILDTRNGSLYTDEGVLVNPVTRVPYRQYEISEGYLLDPMTRFKIDPLSGYQINSETNELDGDLPIYTVDNGIVIDPDTGYTIDPGTGKLIDQNTNCSIPSLKVEKHYNKVYLHDEETNYYIKPETCVTYIDKNKTYFYDLSSNQFILQSEIDDENSLLVFRPSFYRKDDKLNPFMYTLNENGMIEDLKTNLIVDPETGHLIHPITGMPILSYDISDDNCLLIERETGLQIEIYSGEYSFDVKDMQIPLRYDIENGYFRDFNSRYYINNETGMLFDLDSDVDIPNFYFNDEGEIINSHTGLKLDIDSGCYIDPDTELPIEEDVYDEDSELKYQAIRFEIEDNFLIDPNRRYKIDIDECKVYDMETQEEFNKYIVEDGQIRDPHTGLFIDRETGFLLFSDGRLLSPLEQHTPSFFCHPTLENFFIRKSDGKILDMKLEPLTVYAKNDEDFLLDPITKCEINPETGLVCTPITFIHRFKQYERRNGHFVDQRTNLEIDRTGCLIDPDDTEKEIYQRDENLGCFIDPFFECPIDNETGDVLFRVDESRIIPIKYETKDGYIKDPVMQRYIDPQNGHLLKDLGLKEDLPFYGVDENGYVYNELNMYRLDPETGLYLDPETDEIITDNLMDETGEIRLFAIQFVITKDFFIDDVNDVKISMVDGSLYNMDGVKFKGYRIDEETETIFDPETDLPIDKNTGYLIEPVSGTISHYDKSDDDLFFIRVVDHKYINRTTGEVEGIRVYKTSVTGELIDPETNFPINMETGIVRYYKNDQQTIRGYELNEETGNLIDLESEFQIDRETGFLIDPKKNDIIRNYEIEPETNYLINPINESRIDPQTGIVVVDDSEEVPEDIFDSVTGLKIDQTTGCLIVNEETGEVIPEFIISDGYIYLSNMKAYINPETGKFASDETGEDLEEDLYEDDELVVCNDTFEIDDDYFINEEKRYRVKKETGQIYLLENEAEILKYKVNFDEILDPRTGENIKQSLFSKKGELNFVVDNAGTFLINPYNEDRVTREGIVLNPNNLLPYIKYKINPLTNNLIDPETNFDINGDDGTIIVPNLEDLDDMFLKEESQTYFVDPYNGLHIDAETLRYKSPLTNEFISNYFINPEDGTLICPHNGATIDPETGLADSENKEAVYQVEQGYIIDPVSSYLINNADGWYIYTLEPYEEIPKFVITENGLLNIKTNLTINSETGYYMDSEGNDIVDDSYDEEGELESRAVKFEFDGDFLVDEVAGYKVAFSSGNVFLLSTNEELQPYKISEDNKVIDPKTHNTINDEGQLNDIYSEFKFSENNHFLIDPATNYYIDKETGKLIHPTTFLDLPIFYFNSDGLIADPYTGQWIDPKTGRFKRDIKEEYDPLDNDNEARYFKIGLNFIDIQGNDIIYKSKNRYLKFNPFEILPYKNYPNDVEEFIDNLKRKKLTCFDGKNLFY